MPTFNYNYHLCANAQYIYLHNQYKNTDTDYGAIFLHSDINGDEYDRLPLSADDRTKAELVTDLELLMYTKDLHWNEGPMPDYETFMQDLLQSLSKGTDPIKQLRNLIKAI